MASAVVAISTDRGLIVVESEVEDSSVGVVPLSAVSFTLPASGASEVIRVIR